MCPNEVVQEPKFKKRHCLWWDQPHGSTVTTQEIVVRYCGGNLVKESSICKETKKRQQQIGLEIDAHWRGILIEARKDQVGFYLNVISI